MNSVDDSLGFVDYVTTRPPVRFLPYRPGFEQIDKGCESGNRQYDVFMLCHRHHLSGLGTLPYRPSFENGAVSSSSIPRFGPPFLVSPEPHREMNPRRPEKGAPGPPPPKSALGSLIPGWQRAPVLVPPILRQVGRLAAGVASVGTEPPSSAGSATGNPRNKVALQPGHSLMDWIRLGASGKDLTGVGPNAGRLTVSKKELSKHDTPDDAWTAVRGKVYNVTAYLPFHPGGPDELMRAAGIDATRLFDQIHPWVNYDQILQKCLVGRLVAVEPDDEDQESLLFGDDDPAVPRPRFDWIQRLDSITLIFYTRALSNPAVEVFPLRGNSIRIVLAYDGRRHDNEVLLESPCAWPPDRLKVTVETGKVECSLKKLEPFVWDRFGRLSQTDSTGPDGPVDYVIVRNEPVARNVRLLELEPVDGRRTIVPVGAHLNVSVPIDGEQLSRSYTPLPDRFSHQTTTTGGDSVLRLMVKRYRTGPVSSTLTARRPGESVRATGPTGELGLASTVGRREAFVMLAAGTGLTPMAGLSAFLLERRTRRCQFVRLLFFNRTERDIPFREQLDRLSGEDNRFKVDHVLSEPEATWTGPSGRVSRRLIKDALDDHLVGTGYAMGDVFFFVCGPAGFVSAAADELGALEVPETNVHAFGG